ncbi:WD40 repeat-like protein [Trametes coccinea BRFM310]|uniref:WD40 repeat-like protein n=1 Tax=Trametes coccinea (strain BRFM310) TaxID=1353009 RepID=A0A1Y2IUY6_TRAC3|nr:WD40 repeat-like protein [Trametes coccinea BRFM310]
MDHAQPTPQATLYMPIIPPPTPAPSPPIPQSYGFGPDPTLASHLSAFKSLSYAARRQHLQALIQECTPSELLFLSTTITPLLKRDFLRALPPEVSLYILSFIDDPRTLARAALVSRYWHELVNDEYLWKHMCRLHGFSRDAEAVEAYRREHLRQEALAQDNLLSLPSVPSGEACLSPVLLPRDYRPRPPSLEFPYRKYFIHEYIRTSNWLNKGKLLRIHRAQLYPPPPEPTMPGELGPNEPPIPPNPAIPTSVAIDSQWVVVGLANSRIHIFSARTGVLSRTLIGHEAGVWAVALISEGGDPVGLPPSTAPPEGDPLVATPSQDASLPPTLRAAVGLDKPGSPVRMRMRKPSFPDPFADGRRKPERPGVGKPSYPGGSSDGWGQPNALVVSGGCDKELRIWDVKSGYCIYVLRGHTSTVRCLKVLHGRPIAVSGSRDRTVRVWDVQRGRLLRVLQGHTQSVRSLDVCGNRIVSGSYDCTCRIWDVDTGACLHVLRGHFHQIYTVAFDGVRVASGGLDTTVRVWDASTGACLALLQGHTALVCQLQLTRTMLATGGSDGRVITFSLKDNAFNVIQRLAAHDSSVSGLQLDERFLVTSGNDGRVRLYEFEFDGRGGGGGSGGEAQCRFVRDMCEASESVWKVAYTRETCAILCKKGGKMVVEIYSFKP